MSALSKITQNQNKKEVKTLFSTSSEVSCCFSREPLARLELATYALRMRRSTSWAKVAFAATKVIIIWSAAVSLYQQPTTCSYTVRNIVALLGCRCRNSPYFFPSQAPFICLWQRSLAQQMSCSTNWAISAHQT